MRTLLFILALIFVGCAESETSDKINTIDSVTSTESKINKVDTPVKKIEPTSQTYGNARFRNVVVKKLAEGSYRISGEGQIFEASFNWVIEDGHNELKSGYTTTDAGAPAWGKFDFTITISKARQNSQLHLIIYEASAEDGRRQHELPLPLL